MPTSAPRSFLLALCLPAMAASAPALAQQEDHALISSYPESVITRHEHAEFDRYPIILGLVDEDEFVSEPLEGTVTRIFYQNPRGRSHLEISRNYEDALRQAGAEVLWVCEEADCGPGWASSAWNRFNGITTKSGTNVRYVAAKLTDGDGVAYVAVTVGRNRHQIDVVEVGAMETGLVSVTAEAIASGIEREGQVVLDGVLFDTDRATIRPESEPVLEEIARYLREHDGDFFVVGHTDMTGGLSHNLSLSEARAQAVVAALGDRHGIAASRLEGHGVGPLAPAASNAEAGSRERNRRVALVKR